MKEKVMEICGKDICTACGACSNVCPHKCIHFTADCTGAVFPEIDEGSCAGCGLCRKACPNMTAVDFRLPFRCSAAWCADNKFRSKCATGGVGTLLADTMLMELRGVAYGSAYTEQLIPKVCRVEKRSEVEKFKGSRYTQTIVDADILRNVRKDLDCGTHVLFVGTPCQVAGLKSFLGKDYDTLITVDLICHGVSPVGCFMEELRSLRGKLGFKNVTDVRFRGNDGCDFHPTIADKILGRNIGNNYALTIWDGERRLYQGDWLHNYYLAGFITGLTLRENCYNCKYARPERVGDISIGDFIGLGGMEPFDGPRDNTSVVLVSTMKGLVFYKKAISISGTLCDIERQYAERLVYKPSLKEPSKRPKERDDYLRRCKRDGSFIAVRQVLRWKLIRIRMVHIVRHWCRLLLVVARKATSPLQENHGCICSANLL